MHIPVLLTEILEELKLKEGMTVIDGTVGGGGHAQAMLKQIGPTGKLLGLDLDATTLQQVRKRLTTDNAIFAQGSFDDMESIAATHGLGSVDVILLDLGFSSLQLDDPSRGFSFQATGPLDMRLDPDATTDAKSIVNRGSEKQLADILYRYGELYDARRMAKVLVQARAKNPIETTTELVQVLGLKNPGVKAKLFQALRIAVNDELGRLERAIPQAVSLLRPGGRIAIITFHSLEDRIVKNGFKNNHLLQVITKKPIIPTDVEIRENSRSRSAKLRIAQKLP